MNNYSIGFRGTFSAGESINITCGLGSVFFLCRGVDTDKAYIFIIDVWSKAVKILGTDELATAQYESGTLTITNNNSYALSMVYFLRN